MMKKPLFIAFTGPASSGKTTIVKHLTDILSVNHNVYTVNEIVRNILDKFGMSLDEIIENPTVLYEFQTEGLTQQLEIESQLLQSDYDIVIFDRSVYDYFVYAALGLSPELYDKYRQQFKHVENNYDMLVYCEYLGYVDDGFRSKKHIEMGEVGLFQMMVKPYATHVLEVEPHWQRMKRLLNWIEPKLTGV